MPPPTAPWAGDRAETARWVRRIRGRAVTFASLERGMARRARRGRMPRPSQCDYGERLQSSPARPPLSRAREGASRAPPATKSAAARTDSVSWVAVRVGTRDEPGRGGNASRPGAALRVRRDPASAQAVTVGLAASSSGERGRALRARRRRLSAAGMRRTPRVGVPHTLPGGFPRPSAARRPATRIARLCATSRFSATLAGQAAVFHRVNAGGRAQ